MSETWTVREETPGDWSRVRRIHERAFPSPAEAQLVDALRAAGKALVSLVASTDRDDAAPVAGHVLFSPVHIEGAADGAGMAPVAVDPDFQGRGIGMTLVRAGLEACRERGVPYVVVLGNPDYYGRFGFERASGRRIGNEYGVDAEFMVQELVAGSLPAAGGVAKYAEEFAAFDDAADGNPTE